MTTPKAQDPAPATLHEENLRLKRAVEELSILNDLARAIGGSLNSQEIMHAVVHRSLRAIHAEQGVVTIVDQPADEPTKTLLRATVSSAAHSPFHADQSLLGWMHLNKRPITINNPRNDERFRGVKWDPSIRSLVCVPMMVKSELKGVLTVYNRKEGAAFSEEDQRLLAIIAAQSAQIIESARLYEAERTLNRMKEELRLAATIQHDLLPKTFPQIPGYDIVGKSVPAQIVGGDYFDIISLEQNRHAICLGDVSGKGLPASLLMANLQATLRGQTLLAPPAKVCVQRSNKLLYRSTGPEKFVTLFYGILDAMNHTISFCNAGHENPFLLSRERAPRRLKTGGVILSVIEDFPYEEETIPLEPGDLLVVFSDGITEAINPHEELFGEARLAEVLERHRNATAAELIEHIIAAVRSYAGTAPQWDDITLVVAKRLPA